MFESLWRRLTGRAESKTDNLYDLTDEQVERLHQLTKQPGWAIFMSLIDRHTSYLAEQLLNGDLDTLLETRGAIKGFRESAYLVVNILQAKEQRDAKRREQLDADRRRAERRDAYSRFTPFS